MQSQKSQQDQQKAMQENQGAMGQAFDASKNDDLVIICHRKCSTTRTSSGDLKMFVSPDGKSRAVHSSPMRVTPATAEGINLIPQIKSAAFEAIKGTPWRDRRSIWRAPRPPTRICRRVRTGTCWSPGSRRCVDLHHHAVADYER